MGSDTRMRILDAALSQFVSRGVDAVAVTDLEKAAGLSPGSGSFYRHFRSKRDVLAAVVGREIERAGTRRSSLGPRTDLESEYNRALDALLAMRPLIALLVREGTALPDVERIYEVLADGGARVDANDLRERMKAGSIPERDADAVATAVMMSIVGYHLAEQFFRTPVGVDRDRFVKALASLVSA